MTDQFAAAVAGSLIGSLAGVVVLAPSILAVFAIVGVILMLIARYGLKSPFFQIHRESDGVQ